MAWRGHVVVVRKLRPPVRARSTINRGRIRPIRIRPLRPSLDNWQRTHAARARCEENRRNKARIDENWLLAMTFLLVRLATLVAAAGAASAPLSVFGHKVPDTDAICAAMAYAWELGERGIPAEAYRLGKLNRETEYVLETLGLDAPPLLESVNEGTSGACTPHSARQNRRRRVLSGPTKKRICMCADVVCASVPVRPAVLVWQSRSSTPIIRRSCWTA